jgi:catechol 2,3-dioxygenase-like lactoylglutathione lyase family enzyme
MKINHVQLAMPKGQEDRARAFYRDVLGMTEVPKPATMAINGGVWFVAGDAELHLGVEEGFRPATKAHPAIQVADFDAVAIRCEANGYTVDYDDRLPGVRRFYVHDTFGNRIEVMQGAGLPTSATTNDHERLRSRLIAAMDLTSDLARHLDAGALLLDLPKLPSNTIAAQLWCVVGARESYAKAIELGAWTGFSCSLAEPTDKAAVLEALAATRKRIADIYVEALAGPHLELAYELLEHEVQHHGQLLRYFYAHSLPFPTTWKKRYGLE